MFWKLKAHALAMLSRVPAGRSAYHWLQKAAGTNRLNVRRDLDRAFELVDLVHQADGQLAGAKCLEIGTGWRPFVPFVLALGGAREIHTLDINPWLTLSYARETWGALEAYLPEIAEMCRASEKEVHTRYALVPRSARSLDQLLAPLNIHYLYPGDARATGLDRGSIDLVLSSNVLEHIPQEIQEAIHCESLRVLRTGGIAVHRFNPQDHFSTVDRGITHANFLRYSNAEWHWYGGSGLAYHNRLRSRDFNQMFAAAGFNLEISRTRIDPRSLAAICSGELAVHPEFAGYSPQELAGDYMWIVARKPAMKKIDIPAPAEDREMARA
jgi:hypothetical protein